VKSKKQKRDRKKKMEKKRREKREEIILSLFRMYSMSLYPSVTMVYFAVAIALFIFSLSFKSSCKL
jgi:hypothetical protein